MSLGHLYLYQRKGPQAIPHTVHNLIGMKVDLNIKVKYLEENINFRTHHKLILDISRKYPCPHVKKKKNYFRQT